MGNANFLNSVRNQIQAKINQARAIQKKAQAAASSSKSSSSNKSSSSGSSRNKSSSNNAAYRMKDKIQSQIDNALVIQQKAQEAANVSSQKDNSTQWVGPMQRTNQSIPSPNITDRLPSNIQNIINQNQNQPRTTSPTYTYEGSVNSHDLDTTDNFVGPVKPSTPPGVNQEELLNRFTRFLPESTQETVNKIYDTYSTARDVNRQTTLDGSIGVNLDTWNEIANIQKINKRNLEILLENEDITEVDLGNGPISREEAIAQVRSDIDNTRVTLGSTVYDPSETSYLKYAKDWDDYRSSIPVFTPFDYSQKTTSEEQQKIDNKAIEYYEGLEAGKWSSPYEWAKQQYNDTVLIDKDIPLLGGLVSAIRQGDTTIDADQAKLISTLQNASPYILNKYGIATDATYYEPISMGKNEGIQSQFFDPYSNASSILGSLEEKYPDTDSTGQPLEYNWTNEDGTTETGLSGSEVRARMEKELSGYNDYWTAGMTASDQWHPDTVITKYNPRTHHIDTASNKVIPGPEKWKDADGNIIPVSDLPTTAYHNDFQIYGGDKYNYYLDMLERNKGNPLTALSLGASPENIANVPLLYYGLTGDTQKQQDIQVAAMAKHAENYGPEGQMSLGGFAKSYLESPYTQLGLAYGAGAGVGGLAARYGPTLATSSPLLINTGKAVLLGAGGTLIGTQAMGTVNQFRQGDIGEGLGAAWLLSSQAAAGSLGYNMGQNQMTKSGLTLLEKNTKISANKMLDKLAANNSDDTIINITNKATGETIKLKNPTFKEFLRNTGDFDDVANITDDILSQKGMDPNKFKWSYESITKSDASRFKDSINAYYDNIAAGRYKVDTGIGKYTGKWNEKDVSQWQRDMINQQGGIDKIITEQTGDPNAPALLRRMKSGFFNRSKPEITGSTSYRKQLVSTLDDANLNQYMKNNPNVNILSPEEFFLKSGRGGFIDANRQITLNLQKPGSVGANKVDDIIAQYQKAIQGKTQSQIDDLTQSYGNKLKDYINIVDDAVVFKGPNGESFTYNGWISGDDIVSTASKSGYQSSWKMPVEDSFTVPKNTSASIQLSDDIIDLKPGDIVNSNYNPMGGGQITINRGGKIITHDTLDDTATLVYKKGSNLQHELLHHNFPTASESQIRLWESAENPFKISTYKNVGDLDFNTARRRFIIDALQTRNLKNIDMKAGFKPGQQVSIGGSRASSVPLDDDFVLSSLQQQGATTGEAVLGAWHPKYAKNLENAANIYSRLQSLTSNVKGTDTPAARFTEAVFNIGDSPLIMPSNKVAYLQRPSLVDRLFPYIEFGYEHTPGPIQGGLFKATTGLNPNQYGMGSGYNFVVQRSGLIPTFGQTLGTGSSSSISPGSSFGGVIVNPTTPSSSSSSNSMRNLVTTSSPSSSSKSFLSSYMSSSNSYPSSSSSGSSSSGGSSGSSGSSSSSSSSSSSGSSGSSSSSSSSLSSSQSSSSSSSSPSSYSSGMGFIPPYIPGGGPSPAGGGSGKDYYWTEFRRTRRTHAMPTLAAGIRARQQATKLKGPYFSLV